jgi:hypothetical protein
MFKALISTLALLTVSMMIGWSAGGCLAYGLPLPFEMTLTEAHAVYTLCVGTSIFVGFVSAIYYEYE